MKTFLSIVSISVVAALLYVESGHDIKPSQWHVENQIKALKRIQNEMKVSDPIVRDRESRYIQDKIDSLISGSSYDRDEIGPEILIEITKP